MDPLKLLSRSTKLSKKSTSNWTTSTPSAGPTANPQLFGQAASRKRKRRQDEVNGLNFFGDVQEDDNENVRDGRSENPGVSSSYPSTVQPVEQLSVDEAKALLREHKLKITWRNADTGKKTQKTAQHSKKDRPQVFPRPLQSFSELHSRYSVSQRIVRNIHEQGYTVPTEVQLGALPLLLGQPSSYIRTPDGEGIDLLTVAPTGSGKTLAFLIPLLHQASRRNRDTSGISAVILAPTKELVSQIVNEGRKLVQGTGLKISQVRRGMQFTPDDPDKTTVKSDIVVSTPGLLQSTLASHKSPSTAPQTVQHLVLDEADVLLDPLFREQTLSIWTSLANSLLRASLWSATMGSNIEELTSSTITSQHPSPAPLLRLVVGLKDSAIPNITHKLIYAATEQGKLLGLRQLLHPTATSSSDSVPLKPPFLVFTQSIERAVALHSELMYDIPVEAGGISRISVLHSDLSDSAREDVMARFRRGEIWVLITTDLLSRGVDFRGVNGVVNYDLPTSSAAYVHRVGRTGRAGREGGVAVTFYAREDVRFLKGVVNVVEAAEGQQGRKGEGGWLRGVLPSLSKGEKKLLKRRGVEGRSGKGEKGGKRRDRISTKAGFVRKQENNRKGAREATKRLKLEGRKEDEFKGFE